MKKLLACLLALLLPCCALAETYSLDWTMRVSPDGVALLSDISLASGALSEKMAAAVAELFSSLSARFVVSDTGNRYRFSLAYQDLELLLFDAQDSDETSTAVCNLAPGILLKLAVDHDSVAVSKDAVDALNHLSLADFQRRLAPSWDAWVASLDTEVDHGVFAGDAYAGEGRCRTYRFDERDVAVLLESMLAAELNDNIQPVLKYLSWQFWHDEDSITDYLRDCFRNAAMRNRYRYVLRLVDDGTDGHPLTGLSLIVYEGDQQVATLSCGHPETGFKAVLGYGLRGQNYYLSLTTSGTPDNMDQMELQLWQDPGKYGFYDAADEPETNLLLSAVCSASSDDPQTTATLRTTMVGKALRDHQVDTVFTITTGDVREEITTTVLVDATEAAVFSLTGAYADALPPLETSGLRAINITDMTDEEAQLLQDIASDVGVELGIELFRLLPAELMTLLLTTGF